MVIRVADYVAKFIEEDLQVKDVFMITGGGAMYLNDGIAKRKNINVICNHHEQASAMGAVGYSKMNNEFSVVIPTTGCGSTNTITGLLEAWQDNVKVFFISGQVNRRETCYNLQEQYNISLRQAGVQEANIISIVKSITKYSVMINDPNMIAFELEKAKHISESGRPGPVWIDVPLDVQGSFIDTEKILHWSGSDETYNISDIDKKLFLEMLQQSKRPIILAGNGVRLSGAVSEFKEFIEQYNIPVVFTYLSIDNLPTDHDLVVGRVGTKGDRAGNFAVQNCDLLICIGCRLATAVTGFDYSSFAREAKIITVDIDENEHKKNTVKIYKSFISDAKYFLKNCKGFEYTCPVSWIQTCNRWKKSWDILSDRVNDNGVDLYSFMMNLNSSLKDNSVVVTDAGSAFYVGSQSLHISKNIRYITSGAQADMGFTIPASIGVSFANNKNDVIGITGDGSFQFNIQELQTIVHNNLPIKIFVWNNNGYLSIRATQDKFFDGRLLGTDKSCGVSFPDVSKIAKAYGIKYKKITYKDDIKKEIKRVINYPSYIICEVICNSSQVLSPTVSAVENEEGKLVAKPLEDMSPLLSREEFLKEMIVTPM